MSCKLLVFKDALETESMNSRPLRRVDYFSRTANMKLHIFRFGRRNQHFYADLSSDWGTIAAEDQSAVESDVAGKTSRGVFDPVIPMKDNWEPELISNRSPTLQTSAVHRPATPPWC
jgi:hypothetical protein